MAERLTDAQRPCERCEDKGWYWRTPEGFNPFLAGGYATARAMFKVECSCHLLRSRSEGGKP